MGEDTLARISLFRFDPGVDKEPWYQELEAPYQGRTVLDILRHIYEDMDTTLAFRWACDDGCCRSCVVSVNDKSVFACTKQAEKTMKIEPHRKFEVLKDLVVDFDRPRKQSQ